MLFVFVVCCMLRVHVWLLVDGCCLLVVVCCLLFVVVCCLSCVVRGSLFVVRCLSSCVCCLLLVQRPVVCGSLYVGCWFLFAGLARCLLLVAGWLLRAGCGLLLTVCCLLFVCVFVCCVLFAGFRAPLLSVGC